MKHNYKSTTLKKSKINRSGDGRPYLIKLFRNFFFSLRKIFFALTGKEVKLGRNGVHAERLCLGIKSLFFVSKAHIHQQSLLQKYCFFLRL